MNVRVAIITCSDRCSKGEAVDTSGPELQMLVQERGWYVVDYRVLPDEREQIADILVELADELRVDLILTTGGTGLGPRDVTPEATFDVSDRDVPGIAEHIRAESMKVTGRAMLSRAVSTMRGSTLIVNLPGSLKAVREAFGFFADQVEHAVEMAAGGGH